jgi:hypothetical protein
MKASIGTAQTAVAETRRIGEAQVRAYVTIKSATVVFMSDKALPMIMITVVNTGQSPARKFEWVPTIEYSTQTGAIIEPFDIEAFTGIGVDIGAGGRRKAKYLIAGLSMVETVSRHMKLPKNIVVKLRIYYKWNDVFDKGHSDCVTFMGMAERDDPENNKRDVHPLNDSEWACGLEPVAGSGENVLLVREKNEK